MSPVELEGRAIEQCARHAEQLQRMLDAEFAVASCVPPESETGLAADIRAFLEACRARSGA